MTTLDSRLNAYISGLGQNARDAAKALLTATTEQKNDALRASAKALREAKADLLAANKEDVDSVGDSRPDSFIDRLRLTDERVEAMASALEQIAELPDPVGRLLSTTERPNGLTIERVAVPIGVIGMIYESRPNVGADASALCLKSGNAVILRGGSESENSTREIVACMQAGLEAAGLPKGAVQTVETTDRNAVTALLHAVDYVDLVIPRGGRGLVELVRDEAKVPTLLHLDGNCHSYIHADADIEKSLDVVRNAKLRRTGVCGATESIVVDRAIAEIVIPRLVKIMEGCELRGDTEARRIAPDLVEATDEDWSTEYLDPIASVKIVGGLQEAIRSHGCHPDRKCRCSPPFHDLHRQRRRNAQCFNPILRWRGVWHGCRDWHCDGQDARAWAGGVGATDQFQISGTWQRPDPALI